MFNNFNALMGLSCYRISSPNTTQNIGFNALLGLSCYKRTYERQKDSLEFQCPYGLELLPCGRFTFKESKWSFNALMGLSCYSLARISLDT